MITFNNIIKAEANKLIYFRSLKDFFKDKYRRDIFGLKSIYDLNSLQIIQKTRHIEINIIIDKKNDLSKLCIPLQINNEITNQKKIILVKFSHHFDRYDLKEKSNHICGISRIYLEDNYVLSDKQINSNISYFYKIKSVAKKIYQNFKVFLLLMIVSKSQSRDEFFYICIDHSFGGGSNKFSQEYLVLKEYTLLTYDLNSGMYLSKIIANNNKTFLIKKFINYGCFIDYFHKLIKFEKNKIKLIVNSYAGFPNAPEIIQHTTDLIKKYKKKFYSINYFIHDFHSLCPSEKLLNYKSKFCNVPTKSDCKICFKTSQIGIFNYSNINLKQWQYYYLQFIKECTEVRFFSNNTKNYYIKYNNEYRRLSNCKVLPHSGHFLPNKAKKPHGKNIAVLGTTTYSKGSLIFDEFINQFSSKNKNLSYYSIGQYFGKSKKVFELGSYKIEDLTNIVNNNSIGLIILLSIWPETYSYVADEAASLDVKVVCSKYSAAFERFWDNPNFYFIEPTVEELIKVVKNEL